MTRFWQGSASPESWFRVHGLGWSQYCMNLVNGFQKCGKITQSVSYLVCD